MQIAATVLILGLLNWTGRGLFWNLPYSKKLLDGESYIFGVLWEACSTNV
jgi:hypothetical protein